MNNTENTIPTIDPGTQTRSQRFWLLENGFQLQRDLTGTVWLYTFRVFSKEAGKVSQHCVGVFDGGWAVYYCGPTATRVLYRGESFRAVLAHARGMLRARSQG